MNSLTDSNDLAGKVEILIVEVRSIKVLRRGGREGGRRETRDRKGRGDKRRRGGEDRGVRRRGGDRRRRGRGGDRGRKGRGGDRRKRGRGGDRRKIQEEEERGGRKWSNINKRPSGRQEESRVGQESRTRTLP